MLNIRLRPNAFSPASELIFFFPFMILYNDALHASCVSTFGQTLEFMTALVLVWSLLQKTDGHNVAGHPKAGGDTGE